MIIVTLYVIFLSIGMILCGVMIAAARRADAPSKRSFTVLLGGIIFWNLAYMGELLSSTQLGKTISIDIMYVFSVTAIIGWLTFALEHTGNGRLITRGRVIALTIPLIFIILALWTNPLHHQFFAVLDVAQDGPFESATYVIYGPILYAYLAYTYLIILAGVGIILREMMVAPQFYRGQSIALILGALTPVIVSIIEISGVSPYHYINMINGSFTITGMAFGWAVLRSRLFNIVPIARDLLVEHMSDAIIVLDMQNHVVDLNLAAEAVLNRQVSEIVGQPVESAMKDVPDLVEKYRDAREVHDLIELELDGEQHIFDLMISPIVNQWGEYSGRLVGLTEVTILVGFQRELEQQLTETLTINRVLAAITASPDPDSILRTICAELARAFSLPQAAVAVLDDEETELKIVAEYLEPGRTSAIGHVIAVEGNQLTQQVLETKQPVAIKNVYTDPLTKAFAAVAWRGMTSILIVPLLVGDKVVGTLGLDLPEQHTFTAREINLAERVAAAAGQALENSRLYQTLQDELAERRRAQDALEIAKEEAEEANEAKSMFLANMSHELRTPLNSIIGYTDLLTQGTYGGLVEKQVDRLDAVRRNGHQLLSLINDVLDLSKIESGRVEMDLAPLEIATLLTNSIATIEAQAIKKGLVIEKDIADDLPMIFGDMGRVVQVINNLLSNAIKFTPQGSISVGAWVSHVDKLDAPATKSLSGEAVVIAVKDTGIGIAEEDRELIFDEFRQARTPNMLENLQGTGLGLAITRKLIMLMGGQIWLDSTPGQGSTFYVALPVMKEDQELLADS